VAVLAGRKLGDITWPLGCVPVSLHDTRTLRDIPSSSNIPAMYGDPALGDVAVAALAVGLAYRGP